MEPEYAVPIVIAVKVVVGTIIWQLIRGSGRDPDDPWKSSKQGKYSGD